MDTLTPSPNRAGSRLLGLDQARAVAIIAMMVFHFAPGVLIQLPRLEPLRNPVLWFGRMATPAFVVVFGVTAGFVFLPRFALRKPGDLPGRLRRRAFWILVCAVAVTVPVWIRLAVGDVADVWQWVFGLYSVLLFYALALALLPLWLRWLSRHTEVRAVISGAALWALGTAAFYLWPRGHLSAPEFVRMILLSGDFAYLQMMGTAILAIPIGLHMRKAYDRGTGQQFLGRLFLWGLFLSLAGMGWGLAVGEYDVERIVSGELKVPSRPWYYLHFGALALVAISGLELLTRGVRLLWRPGYVLALFGQTALLIFTAHMFVLPGLELTDQIVPLHGLARIAAAFLPFAAFCAIVMYMRHRRATQKPAPKPFVEPPSELVLAGH
ncbi:MAG TPA: acyltransferase family protein [Gemmataceae bacterium]|nr:acyltransferase family protein [Gemmataceae bacterium]